MLRALTTLACTERVLFRLRRHRALGGKAVTQSATRCLNVRLAPRYKRKLPLWFCEYPGHLLMSMQEPEGLLEYGCQYIRDSAAIMQQQSSSPVPPSCKPTDESLARIATTLKLDPVRHRRLRLAGLDERRSSQAILIDALDSYLDTRERFRRKT